MDWNEMTPEERCRIEFSKRVAQILGISPVQPEPCSQCAIKYNDLSPKYWNLPDNPYIPLALRMPPIPKAVYRQEFLDLLQRFEIATGPTGKDLTEK
jgi:hypothetical protein